MNEKQEDNLKLAVSKYKNVCVSISLFTEFLTPTALTTDFNPVTERDILAAGLYGKLLGSNIWVSRINDSTDGKFYIRVSNTPQDQVNSRSTEGWSPLFDLEMFDRITDLKAFW